MGNNQFQKLPYGSARGKLTISEFVNDYYRSYVMKSVQNCSNLPVFDEVFKPPVKAGFYYTDSCQINDKSLPYYTQPGLYKIECFFLKNGNKLGVRFTFKINRI